MPNKAYIEPGWVVAGRTFDKVNMTKSWEHSPRVNGRLQLRGNGFQYIYGVYKTFRVSAGDAGFYPSSPRSDPNTFPGYSRNLAALDSSNYARFRGRIYKGSASLGVTLASYRQSRAMIVNRYHQLTGRANRGLTLLQREYEAYMRRSQYGRYKTGRTRWERIVANFHLEVIFGWVPLLKDIHAACTSVIQGAAKTVFVTTRSKSHDTSLTGRNTDVEELRVLDMELVRSSTILIENPNVWLAERAGLLNPLTVAWDIVPWSFVVNMFVNTGQLVQSITDFAGLKLRNQTKTIKAKEWRYKRVRKSIAVNYTYDQRRTLDVALPLRLVFKLPDASWETAAMAASLFTQKLSLLNRLISKT